MERISSGEMPPEDEENLPTPDQSAVIVEWLAARIAEGKAARLASRQRVNYRRLSREEYVHTVKDLLGVSYDAAGPGAFTEDPEFHGFERIGSILSLSASHIEKYFQAAETILNEAYPKSEPKEFELERLAVDPTRYPESQLKRLQENNAEHFRFELWPQDKFRYANPGRLQVSGVYEMSITLSGLKPKGGRSPRLHVYHEGLDRILFARDVIAPEDQPVTLKFQTHLPAGNQKIIVWNDVPGPSNLPRHGRHGRRPFISIEDGRIPWQLKLTDEQGNSLYPFLIIDRVSWRGPVISDAEAALRARYVPADDGGVDEARRVLGELAKRAFRRPLRPGELDLYANITESELQAGEEFLPAVKAGMLAILSSKSFLFLEEGSAEEDRFELNDWELASRLSYFLWSTMPDDELFRLAETNRLAEPDVLKRQIDRMLEDPRASRFADSFSRQWLRLRKVGMFPPDKKLYPEYDKHLEESMVRESQLYFGKTLKENLPIRELIDSDWTMINPRLALHYGIDGVESDGFQRLDLLPGHHRGGLLTQAAILSLTSDGTRHRPVHRGVWISEVIFGKSPPPPPANVDPVEPNPANSPKATFREKLEAHIHDENCASCHRKIDPYGLAFENYDAIGRWRTEEIVPQGTGKNPPVNPNGELPDGRPFSNPKQFKELLLEDVDQIGEAFVKNLAVYALRRTLTFDDQDEIKQITTEAKANNYRIRGLLETFVLSDLFLKR